MSVSKTFNLNPKLNVFHEEAIQNIIRNNYLNFENIPKIEHNYEMRIHLTSEEPISYSPRRLSYADKIVVNETIDDLLRKFTVCFQCCKCSKKKTIQRECVPIIDH